MAEPVQRPKRIALRMSQGIQYDEGYAVGSITPGMLCVPAVDDADDNQQIKPHDVVGGPASLWVPVEDAYQGKTITDDYSDGALVFFNKALPGDRVFMLLEAGENVTSGDSLSSAGNGKLKEAEEGEHVMAIAREDMDLSDSDAVDTHMIVEITPQGQVPVTASSSA